MRTACPKTIAMIERCGKYQNPDIPVDYFVQMYGATEWYANSPEILPETDRGIEGAQRDLSMWA